MTRSEIQKDLQKAGINVGKDTIKRSLNHKWLYSRSQRKTPLLKPKHIKNRMNFIKKYQGESNDFWNKVICSNGTKI